MNAVDVINAVSQLLWPLLVGVLLFFLVPVLRRVLADRERDFTIKMGSAELSVQKASDTLGERVEDVREQLSALKAQMEALHPGEGPVSAGVAPEESPIGRGLTSLRRVLWVDGHPENNAFEIAALLRKDVAVTQELTTDDALRAAETVRTPFDAVITNMGREEEGVSRPDAGLELIRGLRAKHVRSPIFVYTSAPALARTRDEVMAAGADGATSSATELLELLGNAGLELDQTPRTGRFRPSAAPAEAPPAG